MDCIFCKIVDGDIPSYKIYEDELVIAFLDNRPDSNGHTLIVSKTHYTDLDDIDVATLQHIMMVAKELKKRIEEKLHCTGISLIQNNGTAQEIKHYHLHLKPCYKNSSEEMTKEEIWNILK